MKKNLFLGLDIGGAHVKAVGVDESQKVCFIFYEKCPVWESFFLLRQTLEKLLKTLGTNNTIFGITITAELSDCFKNRKYGAKQIFKLCLDLNIDFYFFSSKTQNFKKKINYIDICSMNWLATGKYLKDRINEGVIIDFGSTTTDLVVIKNKKVINKYFTDYERINNFELIYTGLTRTPLFALSEKIILGNKSYYLIPEFFSSTADLYRVNKTLKKNLDLYDTSDKRSKTQLSSLRRISRNFGIDLDKQNIVLMNQLVKNLIEVQKKFIFNSLNKLIKINNINSKLPLILCGIGQDILEQSAKDFGYDTVRFSSYLKGNKTKRFHASMHAPAAACACLISKFSC